MGKGCEICSGPKEIQFHTIFFDGMMKADICLGCLNQGDATVIRAVGTARWKRILVALRISHKDLAQLANGTGRLPEPLRQPVLEFLQGGKQKVLDDVQVAYKAL